MSKKLLSVGPIVLVLLFTGCGGGAPAPGNSNAVSSASPAASASVQPSPVTEFDRDLQYIRNGGFNYIWIFSRKDGKPLEPADSDFLRLNAPQVVDWVTTDGRRKVIAGTNFNLEEGNLEKLKTRFVAEDYTGK